MDTQHKEMALFLVAGLLACVSIAHWLVFPADVDSDYRNVYHMISSIQGFLTCLVTASCFYFIPKVTDLSSPGNHLWLIGFMAPVGTTASAWLRFEMPDEIMLAVAMVFWAILIATLLLFVYPLFRSKNKPDLNLKILWLGSAIVFGLTGTSLVSIYSTIQIVAVTELRWLVLLGRGFLLQGMFLAIYIAMIPVVFADRDEDKKPTENRRITNHLPDLLAILLLILSLPLEIWLSVRLGFGIRAMAVVAMLLRIGRLWKSPIPESPLLSIIWFSAWLIPMGYLIPLANPNLREVGLHVVFIAGFALGFLSMVLKKILERYPTIEKQYDQPGFVGLFSTVLILSLILRGVAEIQTAEKIKYISMSALVFIFGILLWIYILTRIFRAIRDPIHPP